MRLPAIIALILALGACGGIGTPSPGGTPGETTPPPTITPIEASGEDERFPPGLDRPPPVLVRNGDTTITLEAWSACYGNSCFDGMPPVDPPHVGEAGELIVEFPEPRWAFTATVTPVGDPCGRRQTEPLQTIDGTTHRLASIGFADEYEVLLFGRGSEGDLVVTFHWISPVDGVMPIPTGTASILAEHDGRVDSYGVEILLWNLAATPETVTAEVTVTADDESGHSIPLTAEEPVCSVGSVRLTAPMEEGLAAAEMGEPPFTYALAVELDGTAYQGVGTWQDGEDAECAPCVPLEFTPSLPAVWPGA